MPGHGTPNIGGGGGGGGRTTPPGILDDGVLPDTTNWRQRYLECEDQKAELRKQLKECQEELASAIQSNGVLQTKIVELNKKISELETGFSEYNKLSEDLKSQVEQREEIILGLQTEIGVLEDRGLSREFMRNVGVGLSGLIGVGVLVYGLYFKKLDYVVVLSILSMISLYLLNILVCQM